MNVYASLENLRAVNDNYDSKFFFENVTTAFKKYDNFENIFNEVRVLCLSKSLNKKCFSIFCKPVQGASSAAHSVKGICLEFEYNKQSGITSNDVKYVSQKELNAVRSIPLYIIKKERSFKLKKMFKKKKK